MEIDSIGDVELNLVFIYYFDEKNQTMIENKHAVYNNDDLSWPQKIATKIKNVKH